MWCISELTLKPPKEHHGKFPTCCWPPGAAACHAPQGAGTAEVTHAAEALQEEDTGTGREALCPPHTAHSRWRWNAYKVHLHCHETVNGSWLWGWEATNRCQHTTHGPTKENTKIFTSWNTITMNMNYNSMQKHPQLPHGWRLATSCWGRVHGNKQHYGRVIR